MSKRGNAEEARAALAAAIAVLERGREGASELWVKAAEELVTWWHQEFERRKREQSGPARGSLAGFWPSPERRGKSLDERSRLN